MTMTEPLEAPLKKERPCRHDQIVAGCHLCYLFSTRPDYNLLWGGTGIVSPTPDKEVLTDSSRDSLNCFHLGDVIDRRGCNSGRRCLHECDIHKRCTKADEGLVLSGEKIACCRSCPDFTLTAPATVRRIKLINRQSPGDGLAMTAAIQCLHMQHPGKYIVSVESPFPEVFEANPYVKNDDGGAWERIEMHYPLIHRSNQQPVHFMEAYCRYLGSQLGITIDLTVNRPSLYFHPVEETWISRVEEIYKRPIKHWIINAGVKQDYTAKGWVKDYWQEVVDRLKDKILFVQVGLPHHIHPKLNGVCDQIGKTNLRELIRLCRTAEGGVGGVTFIQHCFAALEKPYVCIAGGREGHAFTNYPNQTTLHTIGALECCKTMSCWKSRVLPIDDGDISKNAELCIQPVRVGNQIVQRCMQIITPDDVVRSILRYYEGGRLSFDPENEIIP